MGGLAADLHVGAGLEQLHVIHAVQNQIAHIVDAIGAVRSNTAGVDVGKVGIGAAFLECNTYLRRSGLVVEFYPQTFQKFQCIFPVEDACLHIPAYRRDRDAGLGGRGCSIPGVQLTGHGQMNEPVHLQRLMEGFRLMSGNYVAVFRDLQQVGFSLGICLGFAPFSGPARHTAGPES